MRSFPCVTLINIISVSGLANPSVKFSVKFLDFFILSSICELINYEPTIIV